MKTHWSKERMHGGPGTAGMLLGMLLVLAGLSGCRPVDRISDRSLQFVTANSLHAWLQQADQAVVLVDVRTAQAFASGHLPAARHLPLPDMRSHDPQLLAARRIVVYADNSSLSTAGVKRLQRLGYRNIFDFRGGLSEWQQAGYPLQ